METSEVHQRIQQALDDSAAKIEIHGADCNFTARVISNVFEGLRPVQRQQRILAAFSEPLASGELHALTVEAFTAAEWQAKAQGGLTQLM
ncbi:MULTISPECIES: BolA family protein [unclassified Oceanobacter]|jgi:monothiol glutaredoxin|uniref:BolA family protein n=1 Tax=unclassified Oceanobacter TaxID=2620260 RepID=UPI0026E29FC7|nr:MULTISPECIES: BolA/IbaG family iron-sulfur metabolism protein [unclassified Oceanobacter]MDO6681718.1 BolA/IbaG family iron-sulfur metabolism protein [Oceanobacter sp. 5_MG-2023]MDP2505654.1 BolA/IbaG family iron-sulfur metabolism protein [Oceanobacter sp. 3_MG-2023]MDP2608307.1 BolA/IbaG family iron-sulfur metabolism protein [Oceanobacter sp. 1_MG-2023]MDP2612192.1 BolA/IbaG family iron-sulfur metabolism protein [Oceanobacter sp. 2_MG-2023]